MDNNMNPTAIAVGVKHTYFLSDQYKFIENNKIVQGTLLNSPNHSVDPYDYHVLKCSENIFSKKRQKEFNSFFL